MDALERGFVVLGLGAELVAEEQHAAGSKIGLGFDHLVAVRRKRDLGVTEQELVVPRDEAMADLVCLDPAVLELGDFLVDEDLAVIGQPKSAELGLLDHIEDQLRVLDKALAGDLNAVGEFGKRPHIGRRVVLAVEP